MDQLADYADDRLIVGCVYCGGPVNTRDHVPSRVLLDPPFPENLPVVPSCDSCNRSFSLDEEYFACLIECVIAGSTNPARIVRPGIAETLRRSAALRARIESARFVEGNNVRFAVELERVRNVVRKLARGHAAYELSAACRDEPISTWWQPLTTMTNDDREAFEASYVLELLGEVGSRQTQRQLVTQISLLSASGEKKTITALINDWLDVQDGYYRYIAADEADSITIKMVVREYLACQVTWRK